MTTRSKSDKLIEDNYKFVYWYIYQHGIDIDDIDDPVGVLSEALVKAARTYDESRGVKFITYANHVMSQDWMKVLVRKRLNCIPLDEFTDEDKAWYTVYQQAVKDPSDFTNQMHIQMIIDKFLATCKSYSDKYTIEKYLEGTKQQEIAKTLGVTKQRINQVVKRFRDYMKSNLEIR